VSRFCGIEAVAVYAIALYLYSLVRTYKSIVYGTFTSRFNHFVGLSDYSGLNRFTTKITVMTAPIIIVPVLILAIMCEPFIISWVGLSYRESGLVTSFLVLFFLTNFISMPAEDYFNAKVQIRTIFYYRLIPLVIYFVGILVVTKYIGVLSFGVCKSFAAFVSSVYVVWVMSRDYRKTNDTYISLKHVLSIVVTVITTGIVCFCLKNIMSCEKSKMDLLHNIVVMVTCYIMCLVIAIPFNQYLRCETKSMISCVKKYCSGFLHVK
jgi:O-antigen/teichoic acid export membrane protein